MLHNSVYKSRVVDPRHFHADPCLDFHFNANPDPTFHFDEDIAVRPSCEKVNAGKTRQTFTRYVKICTRHDMNQTYHFDIQLLK
jgi:hypothetical protein